MTSNTYLALIQARLGSSRLPMKSLLCFRGHALIDWVIQRVSASRRLDHIIVAIPDTPLDHVLFAHCAEQGVRCIQGDENDVLARFCKAAGTTDANVIVRICADNPLIWGEAIDRLILHYENTPCDYAYNHIPRQNLWPDGLGAEILSRELLFELNTKATLPSQREHCLNYIWDNTDKYTISTFNPAEPWLCRPDIKLDIDTPNDFARLALLPFRIDMSAKELVELADASFATQRQQT